ncbi:MmyB family transcriptional regulator [Nocardia takedensis]|uniref:MmyB family transcriptional regulator n=1 Tax=Nocardia takedensis TaxID=259390 RepID=UPI000301BCBD|nr:helix-turn-helix domain-containing protein [Nocardia takedensis]
MAVTRVPRGIPILRDSLEYLRNQHGLSREALAHRIDKSTSLLNQVAYGTRAASVEVLEALACVFNLSDDEQTHIRELSEPSQHLPPADAIRSCLIDLNVQANLDEADARDTLLVYLDPLRTVLLGNRIFHRAVPGLADADGNYFLWLFSAEARRLVADWEDEARLAVTILRTVLGRHRALPRAHALFRKLMTDPDFARIWESTTMQVAYGRGIRNPIRARTPDSTEPISLDLEIAEFGGCEYTISAYGTYKP